MQILMTATIIVQMHMPQPVSIRRPNLPGRIVRHLQVRMPDIQVQPDIG
jgi:hypothetical protein